MVPSLLYLLIMSFTFQIFTSPCPATFSLLPPHKLLNVLSFKKLLKFYQLLLRANFSVFPILYPAFEVSLTISLIPAPHPFPLESDNSSMISISIDS